MFGPSPDTALATSTVKRHVHGTPEALSLNDLMWGAPRDVQLTDSDQLVVMKGGKLCTITLGELGDALARIASAIDEEPQVASEPTAGVDDAEHEAA